MMGAGREHRLMKRGVLALLLAALLLSGCAADNSGAAYRQVGTAEAIELMETETDHVILDVRTREEFEAAHIPGAICIPNETIGGEAPESLPDFGQLILVYCRSGNRSKQAAEKLSALGYTNVVEFGGINSWTGDTVSGEN